MHRNLTFRIYIKRPKYIAALAVVPILMIFQNKYIYRLYQ